MIPIENFRASSSVSLSRANLIPRSRGLRKIRWRAAGRGKRGGIRVIYYLVTGDQIYMLYVYAKNRQEDLTQEQIQRLRTLVDQHLADEKH
jgi:hypothetical protein